MLWLPIGFAVRRLAPAYPEMKRPPKIGRPAIVSRPGRPTDQLLVVQSFTPDGLRGPGARSSRRSVARPGGRKVEERPRTPVPCTAARLEDHFEPVRGILRVDHVDDHVTLRVGGRIRQRDQRDVADVQAGVTVHVLARVGWPFARRRRHQLVLVSYGRCDRRQVARSTSLKQTRDCQETLREHARGHRDVRHAIAVSVGLPDLELDLVLRRIRLLDGVAGSSR